MTFFPHQDSITWVTETCANYAYQLNHNSTLFYYAVTMSGTVSLKAMRVSRVQMLCAEGLRSVISGCVLVMHVWDSVEKECSSVPQFSSDTKAGTWKIQSKW